MLASRISSRLSRAVSIQYRNSVLLYSRQQQQLKQQVPIIASQFHSLSDFKEKVPVRESVLQRFGFSSSASQQHNEKETSQSQSEPGSTKENEKVIGHSEASASANSQVQGEKEESGSDMASNDNMNENVKERRKRAKQTVLSDSDLDVEDLSRDDLVKLVVEKDELLKTKDDEFHKMKDKFVRSYAEMENVMNRTKREAENSKKFAIQNFVKALLDVADNLGRASSVTKESFSKIDESKDAAGAVPTLKTLLQGVEMTEKQLGEVFKKFGVQKYDPTSEQFDPNKHNAVFQVPDPEKAPGVVAVCLKSGYTLHERVIRPAEVGVTVALESTPADQSTEAETAGSQT